jgi:hypothetical protein
VYGGSFSFYVGAHSWSRSAGIGGISSSSTSGSVNASGMNVRLHKVISRHSRALTTTSGDVAYGSNSYGGFMSILHVGAYCWSFSDSEWGSSNSHCGATSLRDVSVHVSASSCSNCSATSENRHSLGANSYGGSLSVLHVGAYSWSFSKSRRSSSRSMSAAVSANHVEVHVSDATCSYCHAVTRSNEGVALGASSYGGSMSVVHVGAYSWSLVSDEFSNTSSTCDVTSASELSVHISGFRCSNCSSISKTTGTNISFTDGADARGGSMSVLYIGSYSWSYGNLTSCNSNSSCAATSASEVSVHVSASSCSNCSATSTIGQASARSLTDQADSYGMNAFGGSISASLIGQYTFSYALGCIHCFSNATVENTHVNRLSVNIMNVTVADSLALTGEQCCNCRNPTLVPDTSHFLSETEDDSYGANVRLLF